MMIISSEIKRPVEVFRERLLPFGIGCESAASLVQLPVVCIVKIICESGVEMTGKQANE